MTLLTIVVTIGTADRLTPHQRMSLRRALRHLSIASRIETDLITLIDDEELPVDVDVEVTRDSL